MSMMTFPHSAHSNGTTAPSIPIVTTGSDYATGVYLLALAVLSHPLEIAARTLIGLNTGRWGVQTVSDALAFVHGSGLNIVFEEFCLDSQPDRFRETFVSWCAEARRHHVTHLDQPLWHGGISIRKFQ